MVHRLSARRVAVAAATAAVLALFLSSCATGEVGAPVSSQPAGASGGSASADSLALAFDGVVGAPPTEDVTVTPGITAWVVSCGEISTTCSTPAAGAADAAKKIGWNASVCDGKLNPDGWASCIRQGIAAKAQVIITVGQDCASVSGALQEARAAGIVTSNVGGLDCDTPLFSATVQDLTGFTYDQYWQKIGELQADWLIGKTGGAVKLLEIEFNDTQWGPLIAKGLTAKLAECSGCSIVGSVQLSNADLSSGALPQKFSTALLQHPDANAVGVPLDGWFLAGLAQAINASGRSSTVNVIGNFGGVPNWEIIRSNGGQDATVAVSQEWQGWAAVDAALRTLAGQPVVPAGIGLQVVDASTNLPASGAQFDYTPAVDFKSAYEAIWKQ